MNDQKIRVGIIGASLNGWASRSHIPALQLLPAFRLTAVSTTRMSSAEAASKAFGAPHAFDNETDLVNCPEVDLVVVAVKVPHHHRLVSAALAAGKMVYCEWPLGNGTAEARDLAAQAGARGLRTFTGLQSLALPETAFLKSAVAEGFVGEVLSTSTIGSGGIWADLRSEEMRYLYDPANGATMLEISVANTLAAQLDVLGPYTSLSALLARRRKEVTLLTDGTKVPQLTDDQVVISGTLENGAVSNLHYRSGLSAGTNFLWEINGTKGDLVVSGGLGNYQLTPLTIQYAAKGEALQPLAVPAHFRADASDDVPKQPAYGLYHAYQAVANDLRQGTFVVPDFSRGVQMHELLDTIRASSRSGTTLAV